MQGHGNGVRMTYHPVVGLGEAPGESVDAVGYVGERAGGGRGGEDRCRDSERLVGTMEIDGRERTESENL